MNSLILPYVFIIYLFVISFLDTKKVRTNFILF